MSQIASFYLLKNGQRQELSNGDCSGAVYMAIWDWCCLLYTSDAADD